MLKLTIPDKDDFYADLIKHKNVLRVVALSGGYTRDDANKRLARNHGMTASFSRALAEGLTAQQSDEAIQRGARHVDREHLPGVDHLALSPRAASPPADRMRFAILGAGALGTILGAHLSRSGHDVVMIARGERARSIARQGLVVTGLANIEARPAVIDDPKNAARGRHARRRDEGHRHAGDPRERRARSVPIRVLRAERRAQERTARARVRPVECPGRDGGFLRRAHSRAAR